MSSTDPAAEEHRRIAAGLAAILPVLHRTVDRRLVSDFDHPKPPEAHLAVLRVVDEHEGITVREVAETLLMKPNNVSALISKLVDDGAMERHVDPDDKRLVRLRLTAEARRRSATVDALVTGYIVGALRTMSDGEVAALGSAVGALAELTRQVQPRNT
ncbi:MarR family winged helix-turn-helix transcriptional regulator [Embleya hyalina]|uniref:MarR family transcriptional regulator n=1 Tax=Embleya hyalina TaxID=516124 RepID=A0A401YT51_9ACTN|nr:MarR family transcriptional regulator [Embleya hyalina]GCD97759.1 MarR family transcriptional regulator [Embleya hyalina]